MHRRQKEQQLNVRQSRQRRHHRNVAISRRVRREQPHTRFTLIGTMNNARPDLLLHTIGEVPTLTHRHTNDGDDEVSSPVHQPSPTDSLCSMPRFAAEAELAEAEAENEEEKERRKKKPSEQMLRQKTCCIR